MREGGRAFRLERAQVVARPHREGFAFFADALNLERITPAFLRFRITTPRPIEMKPGTVIDYRLGLHGVPVKWRTRIETFEPERSFTDVQIVGPHRRWRHRHEFVEVAGGTEVLDVVDYEMPLGPAGLRRPFPRPDLRLPPAGRRGDLRPVRTLVWFRGKDLRVADHAPLREAAASGEVIPLFVLDPCFCAPARARELPHRMQFLLDSLRALEAELAARGSRLLVVEGESAEVVPRLAKKWRVDRVAGHRWTEPFAREGVVARPLYDSALGPLRRADSFWPAACLFYPLYIAAIVIHAELAAAGVGDAARRGAGLGLVTYGTYELTNWAVLREWPALLVLPDIAWGVALTCATAVAGKAALCRMRTGSPR